MSRTTDESTESRIALFAGGDLDDRSADELRRQLASCPDARACHDEMNESLSALHACRDRSPAAEPDGASLWPRLATRLHRVRRSRPLESLRPWVPALTVAALVMALLTVATSPPPRNDGSPFASQMPNAHRPSFQPARILPERPHSFELGPQNASDRRTVPFYVVPAREVVEYDFREGSGHGPDPE